MSKTNNEHLYQLLPAIYRQRDVKSGEPLRALFGVLQKEFELVETDIAALYADWFIETCDEWVVPYIGDLLGVKGLFPLSPEIYSQRAYIANTLAYRRRKGTAAVLEQLARDITNWPARVVEFFELLGTTQHLNHVRLHNQRTPNLRDTDRLELIDGPFERAAHTADVRRIAQRHGKYNIPNVGLFLWRLDNYFVTRGQARLVSDPLDARYTFSPLGCNTPLFNLPQTETEITQLAREVNVPGRLRRRPLYDELEAWRQTLAEGKTPTGEYFGEQPVLQVFLDEQLVDGVPVPLLPEQILICNLGDWRKPPSNKTYQVKAVQPDGTILVNPVTLPIKVAVDPVLGRLTFPSGEEPNKVHVSYSYGFSADIGGGPYDRRLTLADASTSAWIKTVAKHDPSADFTSLGAALAAWADPNDGDKDDAVITILDSDTYSEEIEIQPAEGKTLVIQADDNQRPLIRFVDASGDLGELVVSGGSSGKASITLNGLLVEGGIRVEANSLGRLHLMHCALVPGRQLSLEGEPKQPHIASIHVDTPNTSLALELDKCIVGAIRMPGETLGLWVRDSIVDSPLRRGQASLIPALISKSLATFPALSSGSPSVAVTIGGVGPHTAVLSGVPTSLAQARDQLQAAIQTAHSSVAFSKARVISAANRLIVLSGASGEVEIAESGSDATASELRLDAAQARQVMSLVSGELSPFPGLSSTSPTLNVTVEEEGPHAATLASVPATLSQARAALHDAIRNAHMDVVFAQAIVGKVDDRLVVLPGKEGATLFLSAPQTDASTLYELKLDSERPAIAARYDGAFPGPPSVFERSTVFGRVFVRELELGSESIFTSPVEAQRTQVGCVRYSFLADGSRVPRRYRCQPDIEINAQIEKAEAQAKAKNQTLSDPQRDAIRAKVLKWLVPTFTSTAYTHPAYGQLHLTCPTQIRKGAEDGSEMGVFSLLKQPQREANLVSSLQQYLRFGLEAGIIYVT